MINKTTFFSGSNLDWVQSATNSFLERLSEGENLVDIKFSSSAVDLFNTFYSVMIIYETFPKQKDDK